MPRPALAPFVFAIAAATLPLCALALADQTPQTHAETRVLFIGNSYTHANNIPGMVGELARTNGQHLDIALHLPGGRTFQKHWEEGRAAELIRAGGWDVIILQNQSYEPVGDPANMLRYARQFADLARTHCPDVRLILYNTWAYLDLDSPAGHQRKYPNAARPANPEEMQQRVDAAYAATALEVHAEIAPVGQAWTLARMERPALRLHGSDGSHPNPVGSLLAALVLHRAITGEVAPVLPHTFDLPSKAGQPDSARMALEVEVALAAFLKSIAARAAASVPYPPPDLQLSPLSK